jgi:hypothetical protein
MGNEKIAWKFVDDSESVLDRRCAYFPDEFRS